MMSSDDLMRSIIILMQGGIGDTTSLYSILNVQKTYPKYY